ncbi:glycosyltransferase family 8 protein [Actinoplanes sp. ATCC 53533]|uniref:glycosyltransferase family 8 protein n=1 Tax=Actinoplanes sp. ATCC 53533 TaxID=1288362 RepID=UPI0013153B4C|nr:glycosyltransferase family 8 protein [Actinoplanes sp. ATCC 53533]
MSSDSGVDAAAEDRLPPIVCGVDQRYLVALGALMASIAAAHPGAVSQLRLIVLHHGLGRADRAVIVRWAAELGLAVQVRSVTDVADRYPVSGWVSAAVYLRLAIPEVLGEEPRVLYLDADTLVVDDLRPLLRHPLGDAALAAVRDPQNPAIGSGIALPGWRRLGLPYGRDYFNSGVLLLDLVACARDDIFGRARRFLTQHPDEARLWDQDALNVAAGDRWVRLDRRWNTFAFSGLSRLPGFVHERDGRRLPVPQLVAEEDTAAVLHFAGPVKPWHDDYPPGPARDRYRRFLAAAPVVGAR